MTAIDLRVRHVTLHGHRVGYRMAGEGPVVLLIHGMAGCSRTWLGVMPILARDYTVVAPDLLGHGESAKPMGDYSLGAHASGIRDLLVGALEIDRATVVGQSLALRATHERSRDSVEILLGEVIEERHPYTGRVMYRRADVVRPERLPQFQTFRPTETERAPGAYVVPPELTAVLHLLDDHGVTWSRLDDAVTRSVERFVIDSNSVAEREYQGHHQRTLYGRYETVAMELAAGTAIVPVGQPLGRLAFALLEPRSDDGALNWNVLDDVLEGAAFYPILRLQPEALGGPLP